MAVLTLAHKNCLIIFFWTAGSPLKNLLPLLLCIELLQKKQGFNEHGDQTSNLIKS